MNCKIVRVLFKEYITDVEGDNIISDDPVWWEAFKNMSGPDRCRG